MLISGYGAGTNITTQIRGLQDTMGDLQRQLATGKVARDYAGLGGGRDISLTMRAQLSKSSAYDQTIAFVSGRLEATQLVLGRIEDIMNDTAGGTLEANVQLTSDGQTVQQMLAERRFEETLALLNTEYEDRRIFGGRRSDAQTNIGADAILNGTPGKDGLLRIIDERKLADTDGGASATGRIAVTPVQPAAPAPVSTATTVTMTDDASPFGLKVQPASLRTSLAAVGTIVPDPDTYADPGPLTAETTTVDVAGGSVVPGSWLSFDVALPDGTVETVRLEAVADAPASAYGDPERGYLKFNPDDRTFPASPADLPNDVKGFVVGASDAETAANLRVAVQAALMEVASEKLPNASAKQAADDYFAYDDGANGDPKRVDTSTYAGYLDTTPAQLDAARAKTARWYSGEIASDPARKSAVAKIDDSLKVNYGARANEQLFKDVLANLAVFATEEFSADTHANRERYSDLTDRVRAGLSNDATQQRSRAVQADFASVQVAVDEARQRHRFRDVLAEDMIDKVEAADDTEVASKLLALQTQLQMSFQTTAMISRLSLANIL